MQVSDIFLNSKGRLRSGWRATVFGVAFLIATSIVQGLLVLIFSLLYGSANAGAVLDSNWGFVAQAVILLISAILVGYLCQKLFEDLPLIALGWAFHHRWFRDWLSGSLLGALTLVLATLIVILFSGFKFNLSEARILPAVGKTLLLSFLIFILAAAAEEVLFRGYTLQTFTRANLVWLGIAVTAIFFALAHQGNPNQNASMGVRIVAFTNTALAGVWLAVVYLKSRSLWLPLGAHWAWNWMMAAVLGLPVSGITRLTPNPLFNGTDLGPAWLTGGPYGIEGGVACTFALALSTVFVWRTKLFSATDEMKALTTGETPRRTTPHFDRELTEPSSQ